MTDREGFFQGLRSALASSERPGETTRPGPFPSDDEVLARVVAIQKLIAEQSKKLIDELAASAEAGGWIVHRAANAEEALGHVVDVTRGLGITSLVRSDHDVLSRLGVDGPLAAEGVAVTKMAMADSGDPSSLRSTAINAGLGLTGSDYAIAETGSVVLAAGQGVSRIVSLVPPVHVAVVEQGSVVPGLDEMFTLLRRDYGEEDWTSYVNIISGPSRSADIEYTLVTGVHGPGEVHLVLLDECSA